MVYRVQSIELNYIEMARSIFSSRNISLCILNTTPPTNAPNKCQLYPNHHAQRQESANPKPHNILPKPKSNLHTNQETKHTKSTCLHISHDVLPSNHTQYLVTHHSDTFHAQTSRMPSSLSVTSSSFTKTHAI